MGDISNLMNEINWLITLLAAIPLSVVANLFTPRIQNWLAHKSRGAAGKRLIVVEREFEQARQFASDKVQLNTYLLVSVLGVIILFSLPNVVNGIVTPIWTFSSLLDTSVSRALTIFSGMFSALLNLMAITRAIDAITVFQRVRDFQSYTAKAMPILEQLRSRTTSNPSS
jgi:hypothetical protein